MPKTQQKAKEKKCVLALDTKNLFINNKNVY